MNKLWYGWLCWMMGWTGMFLISFNNKYVMIIGFIVGVGGYGIMVYLFVDENKGFKENKK